MPTSEQRRSGPNSQETQGPPAEAATGQARRAALDADVDAILDEIDEVLEENAAEFVKGFVQKGGQ
ncbi:MAG: ubiquitin-like protein Pup [Actinomycetes bacterium]